MYSTHLNNKILHKLFSLFSLKEYYKRFLILSFIYNVYTVKPRQTTTSIRRPMLYPPMQISIQSLLYKTTTCLTQPATTFLVSQMKKNLSITTTTKLYPAKKWETNIRQQCIILYLLYYNIKFV